MDGNVLFLLGLSELLDVAPVLIIATSGAVVELNAQTLDLLSCTSLLGW